MRTAPGTRTCSASAFMRLLPHNLPTYDLGRVEMDSPRGRLALMAEGLEPGSRLTPEMVEHFDSCLGCMACVTACPSGVQYDKLIQDTRAQVERHHRRPLRERMLRRSTFALSTHPGRLRATVPLIWLARVLRLDRIAERLPSGSRLRGALALAPSPPLSAAVTRLPQRFTARGEARGRVGLLQGCVQRVLFAGVNRATAEVLAAEGFDVHAPRLPRCCGALQLHAGDELPAKSLAKETITAFEDCEFVVANAAGCGSALKDYAHLLRDEPGWADRAASSRRGSATSASCWPSRGRARSATRCRWRSPTTTPAISRTLRGSARRRAASSARSRGSSWPSPPTGRPAAARPGSTT